MTGVVFDIKRFAAHDGPGIRTTIFLKGCPLRCWWCHNPESQSSELEYCTGYHKMGDTSVEIENTIGKIYEVSDLMEIIQKDTLYYEESGGGVTFSGGEPLMQAKFLKNMLIACKENDIRTAVDTSGYASPNTMMSIAEIADIFLFDIKHLDDREHEAQTGKSLIPILRNFEYLIRAKKKIIVRIPIIPTFNADTNFLNNIILYLSKLQESILQIDLLPFHRLGNHKYSRLGMNSRLLQTEVLDKNVTQTFEKSFLQAGFKVRIGG